MGNLNKNITYYYVLHSTLSYLIFVLSNRENKENLITRFQTIKNIVMNTQKTQIFTTLSKEEKQALTSIVKETLAFDAIQKKSFSAADLWNIQRQRRAIISRKYFGF